MKAVFRNRINILGTEAPGHVFTPFLETTAVLEQGRMLLPEASNLSTHGSDVRLFRSKTTKYISLIFIYSVHCILVTDS